MMQTHQRILWRKAKAFSLRNKTGIACLGCESAHPHLRRGATLQSESIQTDARFFDDFWCAAPSRRVLT